MTVERVDRGESGAEVAKELVCGVGLQRVAAAGRRRREDGRRARRETLRRLANMVVYGDVLKCN